MKFTTLFLIAISLCAIARSEPIDTKSAITADNVYTDTKFNVRVKVPSGWIVPQGVRWGANNSGENTIMFRPPTPSLARPSMYYAMFYDKMPAPASDAVSEWFSMVAGKKESARQKSGLANYRNDSGTFEVVSIAGRPAFSYTASYTANDRPMLEHFMYIIGSRGFVMFFTQGPVIDVREAIPTISAMAANVVIP